jgi:hypothetical protein
MKTCVLTILALFGSITAQASSCLDSLAAHRAKTSRTI